VTDVTTQAARAIRRARLVETILLDRVVEQAADEQKHADPKADPMVAAVWTLDGGGTIGDRPWHGKAGQLQLVPGGVADVLKDAGIVEMRESLTLPPWQRPEVAGELRAVAAELQQAADQLDPPAKPLSAKKTKREDA
jgi:hypothetical protein